MTQELNLGRLMLWCMSLSALLLFSWSISLLIGGSTVLLMVIVLELLSKLGSNSVLLFKSMFSFWQLRMILKDLNLRIQRGSFASNIIFSANSSPRARRVVYFCSFFVSVRALDSNPSRQVMTSSRVSSFRLLLWLFSMYSSLLEIPMQFLQSQTTCLLGTNSSFSEVINKAGHPIVPSLFTNFKGFMLRMSNPFSRSILFATSDSTPETMSLGRPVILDPIQRERSQRSPQGESSTQPSIWTGDDEGVCLRSKIVLLLLSMLLLWFLVSFLPYSLLRQNMTVGFQGMLGKISNSQIKGKFRDQIVGYLWKPPWIGPRGKSDALPSSILFNAEQSPSRLPHDDRGIHVILPSFRFPKNPLSVRSNLSTQTFWRIGVLSVRIHLSTIYIPSTRHPLLQ